MPYLHSKPVKGEAEITAYRSGFSRRRLGLNVPWKRGIIPPLIGHIIRELTKIEHRVRKCAWSLNLENRIWTAPGGGQLALSPAVIFTAT